MSVSRSFCLRALLLLGALQAGAAPAALAGDVPGPSTLLVDASAAGAGNGTSWCDAYTALQDALAAAVLGDTILVADGVYRPDQGAGQQPGNREATFLLVDGVWLQGGFAGCGAAVPGFRDIVGNPTTLSGDLVGNDGASGGLEDNSRHVVTATGSGAATLLEGFIIQGGHADLADGPAGRGAALLAVGGALAVADCTFHANLAVDQGGGAFLLSAATTFTRCTFTGNSAAQGGAAAQDSAQPRWVSCRFLGNNAQRGAALACALGNIQMINCTFSGNAALDSGGAVFNFGGLGTLTNCTFTANSSGEAGGAIFSTAGGSLGFGKRLFTVRNGVFWNDVPNEIVGSVGASFSIVEGAAVFPGQGNLNVNPLLANPTGSDGQPGTLDDDLRPGDGSPAVDAGNSPAVPQDILTDLDGHPRLVDDLLVADTGIPVTQGGPVVDLGAYEFFRDCNHNGIPDDQDLQTCDGDPACSDCNQNGVPDGCDIAQCDFQEPVDCDDCNLSGIPDVCETDGGTPEACVNFVGACAVPDNVLWSCFDNWDLSGDIYPDNDMFSADGPYSVVLDNLDEVILDVTVRINTLRLIQDATLRILPAAVLDPPASGDLTVTDANGVELKANLLVGGDQLILVENGTFLVNKGGVYRADPNDVPPCAASTDLSAPQTEIRNGTCPKQGMMGLSGDMVVDTGEFLMNGGGDDPPQDPDTCPPCLEVTDAAVIMAGDFVIDGDASIDYRSSEPLQVSGDFVNGSDDPDLVDWEDGAIKFADAAAASASPPATLPKSFEVAGRDLGPVLEGFTGNFSVGELRLDPGVTVVLRDSIDNDRLGQGPCSEALYVKLLVLEAGAQLLLQDTTVYYQQLTLGTGAVIAASPPSGCGAAVPVTPPDCTDGDGDGRVTICHIPPGNPNNPRTITVSVNAIPAHLAHGDSCGPCPAAQGGGGGRR